MGALSKSQDVAEQTTRALEEDILLGRLYPRERLVEEQLAQRFDIKRHVVRQVLQELENAGLVVRAAGKGVVVREYSHEEVNNLYEMRDIVESAAARRISLPVSAETFAELKNICDDYSKAVDDGHMQGVIAANKLFHSRVYALCGNQFLVETIESMAKKSNLVRFSTNSDPVYLQRANQEHFGILTALGGSDNDALANLCVAHLQPSRQQYLARHAGLSRNSVN